MRGVRDSACLWEVMGVPTAVKLLGVLILQPIGCKQHGKNTRFMVAEASCIQCLHLLL